MCPNRYAVKDKVGNIVMVNCGQCAQCRRAKSREWSLRLTHELSSHQGRGAFVTLTYSDEHLRFSCDGLPVLYKPDLQNYIKLLRYNLGSDRRIKYYGVGEYGDANKRPHYHIIIFGVTPLGDKSILVDTWRKGIVDVGSVEVKSIQYVTQYTRKKLTGKLVDNYPGKQPPFCCRAKDLGHPLLNQLDLPLLLV